MLRLPDFFTNGRGTQVAVSGVSPNQPRPTNVVLESVGPGWPPAFQEPSLIDHIMIVRAFMLRELRVRYRFNPVGFLMEMLRPTIVIGVHYLFFLYMPRQIPAGVPLEIFVIGGFTAWFAFQATYNAMLHSVSAPGFNRLPGVTRMHVRVSRAFFTLIINIMFLYGAVFLLDMAGDNLPIPDVPMVVLVMTCLVGMGFGLGLIMEALARLWPIFDPIAHILTWGFYITSGMYGCISISPNVLTPIYLWNPVLNCIEYMRNAMDAGYPIALLSMKFFMACTGAILLMGLLVSRAARRVVTQ